MLAFLGVPAEGAAATPQDKYCQACRDAGIDECATCDRDSIRMLN